MLQMFSNIKEVKGVGDKTCKLLNKLGIYTVKDMLEFYPRTYVRYEMPADICSVKENTVVAVYGRVTAPLSYEKSYKTKKAIIKGQVKDETGVLSLIWFNAPYLRNIIRSGEYFVFYGTVRRKGEMLIMEQPKYYHFPEYEEMTKNLIPVYNKTEGLTNNAMIRIYKEIRGNIPTLKEYLPKYLLEKYRLMGINKTISNIHFPENEEMLKAARERVVFDEFFAFLYKIRKIKEETCNRLSDTPVIRECFDGAMNKILSGLSYDLTGAQVKVLEEIKEGMASGRIMRRIIQGDVGSGKTIIAFIALLACANAGYQGALMAPTEVLAKQHFKALSDLFDSTGINVNFELLTGATTAKEKRRIYEGLETGEVNIVIGTHALVQEKVSFANLGLVITDEQHRFGVNQREGLSKKGNEPHVLVMSATPIPRTLALILYGDMDLSVIDEVPKNRLPIKNCVVNTDYRNTSYKFILDEIKKGHQAYVICPLIEENENIDAPDVISYSKDLQQIFGSSVKVSYLHGKMTNDEKNKLMDSFAKGDIQVLVSTTVIEVGINVPNATVMMIEGAERFGLASLHQLRGRVGRGEHQSYCIMVNCRENEETKKRLEIMNKSNDGFYIASEDLKTRGAGDLFGYRQSGDVLFRIADIYEDAEVLEKASKAVEFLNSANEAQIDDELKRFLDNCDIIEAL